MYDKDNDKAVTKEEYEAGNTAIAARAAMPMMSGIRAIKPSGEGEQPQSAVLWVEQKSVPEVPAPLLVGDHVCVINNGGVFSCMDAKTGAVAHRGRVGTPGAYFSSPIVADGKIYVSNTDGVVSVIQQGTWEVLAKNDLGEGVFATPAPIGSRLYVRTTGHLWAFGK
jgi:outer membrane protein assembly factor BamB